jgi:mRNA interferase HigB
VHIISRKALKAAATRHPDLAGPLDTWYQTARAAQWSSLADVRKTYRDTDTVGELTVFNIKGNAYRLIVKIEYRYRLIFIAHVLTHAEYDKGDWHQ